MINEVHQAPEQDYPSWVREASLETVAKDDKGVVYAGDPRTVERDETDRSGLDSDLVFDHVNAPVTKLTDYSVPQKKMRSAAGSSRKRSARTKGRPKTAGLKDLRPLKERHETRPGWGGNDTINIHVNPQADDKTPSKAVSTGVDPLSRVEERYNRYGELTSGKKVRQFGYDQVRWAVSASQVPSEEEENLIREKKGAPMFSQDNSTRLFSQSKGGDSRFYSGEYTSLRPVSSEYIIAPGDEVFVKITGPVDIAEVFAVDRNGQLFIPKIGAVNLAGRTASELQQLVVAKAKEVFVNAAVEASLGRLRSIQVTVTGNVKNPGLLRITANSSLLNALAAAGGPDKDGTLRRVALRRRNHPDQIIDLYSILMGSGGRKSPVASNTPPMRKASINGTRINFRSSPSLKAQIIERVSTDNRQYDVLETREEWRRLTINGKTGWLHGNFLTIVSVETNVPFSDPALLPGDIIHVGPIGDTVAVISPGDDGAIYEVKEGSTFKELGERVGFVNSFTDNETVLVERSIPGSGRSVEAMDFKTQAGSFGLSDGDIFQFFPTHPYSYNSVAVSGPVMRPGAYPFSENMRVSDLLKLAKGFLVTASLERALLVRELGNGSHFNIMPGDNRGRHRKQLIWLDLAKILTGDNTADMVLARLDRLKLFTMSDEQPKPMVEIIGGVRKPGNYHLTAGMTLGDLLGIAGGPSEKAYDGESSIVRRRHSRDGKRHFDVGIIPFNLVDVMDRDKVASILLENHDKIVIRQVNNLEIKAKIDGWVQFPGTYILPSGSSIQDLVRIAGGILAGADLRAAVFKRHRVARLQDRRLKTFYASSTERFARTRDEVTLAGRPSESLANQLSLMGQDRLYLNMKQFQTNGRVVIDLTAEDFLATDDNLILEDGDSLTIPQKMTTVMVMGRIFNPSGYLWKQGLKVEDYLNKSGGFLEDADKEHVYVVMANGEIQSAAQEGGRSALMSFQPGPGDIVFVPQEPLGRSTMAQIMDVLHILRMAAETSAIGAAIPSMDSAVPSFDLGSDSFQKRTLVDEYSPEMYENDQQWQYMEEVYND